MGDEAGIGIRQRVTLAAESERLTAAARIRAVQPDANKRRAERSGAERWAQSQMQSDAKQRGRLAKPDLTELSRATFGYLTGPRRPLPKGRSQRPQS